MFSISLSFLGRQNLIGWAAEITEQLFYHSFPVTASPWNIWSSAHILPTKVFTKAFYNLGQHKKKNIKQSLKIMTTIIFVTQRPSYDRLEPKPLWPIIFSCRRCHWSWYTWLTLATVIELYQEHPLVTINHFSSVQPFHSAIKMSPGSPYPE